MLVWQEQDIVSVKNTMGCSFRGSGGGGYAAVFGFIQLDMDSTKINFYRRT
jgi:hypothetical protein